VTTRIDYEKERSKGVRVADKRKGKAWELNEASLHLDGPFLFWMAGYMDRPGHIIG
jgi:hypothetical protein